MSEHRGHLGGALLTIAGAALIGAGLGSTLLIVLGALCIVGALWAFGAGMAVTNGVQWLRTIRIGRPSRAALPATQAQRVDRGTREGPPLTDQERIEMARRVSGRAVQRASDNLLRALDREGADEKPETPRLTPQFEKWLRKRHARGKDKCQKIAIVRTELLTAFAAVLMTSPSFNLKAIRGTIRGWGRELSDGLREAGFTDEADDAAGTPPEVDDDPTTADCDALTAYVQKRMGIIQGLLNRERA